MGHDDAVVFSDEVESVPSLASESDDEEEEEEEWDSDEEFLEDDEEDAELNEGLAERRQIFADARALKTLAVAFFHPEKPVDVTDGTAFGRNCFELPPSDATTLNVPRPPSARRTRRPTRRRISSPTLWS